MTSPPVAPYLSIPPPFAGSSGLGKTKEPVDRDHREEEGTAGAGREDT